MDTLYLRDMLHLVSQSMLVPVMALLIALIAFSLFHVGSVIAEFFTERRHFKVVMPKLVNAIHDADGGGLTGVIEDSGLLRKQKDALITLADNIDLPDDDLYALAKSSVFETNARYEKTLSHMNLSVKIAPMLGLMGTLIPLGPGVVALGQGDTATLSKSLLIAFDGTVTGLVIAIVCMAVVTLRKRWYGAYMVSLESAATCILEKAAERNSGKTPKESSGE
ncbi:MAG: transporter [Coriobacteriia bacterium]|nr:transporter [Coriobacteriia bacterium]